MAPVLFTHPYHLALDPREEELGRPYPPLGTMVAAAVARRHGLELRFHDPMFERDERGFGAVLDGLRPSAVVIAADDHSVQVKQCLNRVRQAHQEMARQARRRGLPVIVAGPDVSDRPQEYLAAGADAAVVGESVEALAEWVGGAEEVQGVQGRRGAGGRRGVIADLDRLPPPDWSLVDMGAYARRWRQRHGHWEASLWTARGCPYRCNWCAKPTWGRSYHVRSPEAVVAEMVELQRRHAPDRIWFTDDIFGLRPSWLRRFRELVQREGLALPYRCLSRADLLQRPEVVEDLAASGCRELWMGAESGADTVLRAMDKDGTVAEVEVATRLLQRAGVQVGLFLQLGYPGEGLKEVLSTVEMVGRLAPDQIGVSVSYPLPGTAFFERVASIRTGQSWEASMENRTLYQAPFSDPFYAAAKELLRSTWRVSRAPADLRAFLRQPDPPGARRLLSGAWHRLRLPAVRRRVLAEAQPKAAVP